MPLMGYKHNISCSFRYHHPGQSPQWNDATYGKDHFSRGVGVNLTFWSWWTDESGQQASLALKNILDHRWLFADTPTTPEVLLQSMEQAADGKCLGLCLIENQSWAVASDRQRSFLIYREKDFSEQKEFHFSKQVDPLSGLLILRAEARQKALSYCENNTDFMEPLVGYKHQHQVRPGFIGQTSEAVQHGVLFSFPIVWP